jgi:hypothetical protein
MHGSDYNAFMRQPPLAGRNEFLAGLGSERASAMSVHNY